MRLKRFAVSRQNSGSMRRYRWVMVWLGCGSTVALLLLANTIWNYMFVSRVLATQQVSHQITQMSAQVEQEMRREGLKPDTLQKALEETPHDAESVTLRSSAGDVIEHLGMSLPSTPFSADQEHAAFSQHEPLVKTISTTAGDMIVQVIPVRAPPRPGGAFPTAGPGPRPPQLILEIALPLKSADASVLGPLRRNLIVNCVAALSLFATVVLAWIGLRSYEQGRRLEEQVEIARQVQSRLLPPPTLRPTGIEMSTEYKPSEQVGGDFYDVFPAGRSGLACLIGDVSGKGVPAALLMGVIHGAVRTADWQSSTAEHEEASGKLNRLLCDRADDHRFASMFWCVYDQPQGSLRYVNAGHCPPFLISRRDGSLRTTRLDRGGPVLGLLPEAAYEATTTKVCCGDLLVMYSDGLVEAMSVQGEEYGEDRLSTLLSNHVDEAPDQLRERLLSSLGSFASGGIPQDDLTFAVIKF